MHSADNFKDIVTRTFVDRAIRSALLVDDQFPRFDQLIDGTAEKYKESDRAGRIYEMFRERNILCDVENSLTNIEKDDLVERIRKSDFILLDYHLTADENEISHSIRLLKRLATSHHFNTVVVYTKHPDLTDVWLNIAVNLKGGWKTASEILDGDLIEKWDELQGESRLPSVDEKMLVDHLSVGDHDILRSELGTQLRKEFVALEVDQKEASKFITSAVYDLARARLIDKADETEYSLVGSCKQGGPFWLQSGNVFIAIVQKSMEDEFSEDPQEIFEKLSEALVDWNPNVVQILLSEIQNILELGGLAADEDYTGTPERQVGIGYHLLSMMPDSYTRGDTSAVNAAITSTVEKITESIRKRLVNDGGMLDMTRELVEPMITSDDWAKLPNGRKDRVVPLAKFTKLELSRSSRLENEKIFVDLNTFLSTERFGGVSVTTGTVFSNQEKTDWWLCSSPACDMAPRAPSDNQTWLRNISPSKCMVALKLQQIGRSAALKNAENSTNIFITDTDAEDGFLNFNVFTAEGHPVWEVMLVSDFGKVTKNAEKYCFTCQRIAENPGDDGSALVISNPVEFTVAAQLKPEYAARLLQITGQHLSRIGVDFVNLP